MLKDAHITLIGGGIMGEAITKGLIGSGATTAQFIAIAEPNEARRGHMQKHYGVTVTEHNVAAAHNADIIVMSIKPQQAKTVLNELNGKIKPTALIFSIMAGVSIETITGELGAAQPVVRVMPNTPAQIGQGISVWVNSQTVTDAQREQARSILAAMGKEVHVDDESYLDMATALVGSGPAYVFLFMEAMIDAGVHMGFPRGVSEKLVMQTMRGSIEFADQSGLHPAQLKNQITSSGGTTAAALYQLEKGRFRTVVSRAIWAAYERSVELGKPKKK
jgi:pyrroline-5-carboxylate reductase